MPRLQEVYDDACTPTARRQRLNHFHSVFRLFVYSERGRYFVFLEPFWMEAGSAIVPRPECAIVQLNSVVGTMAVHLGIEVVKLVSIKRGVLPSTLRMLDALQGCEVGSSLMKGWREYVNWDGVMFAQCKLSTSRSVCLKLA